MKLAEVFFVCASDKKTQSFLSPFQEIVVSLHRESVKIEDMTTRREKSKPQKPQLNKQVEAMQAEEPKVKVNQRKEKFADFLIDVAKYVLTGVVITSLFNDVTDKTTIYLIGIGVVCTTLLLGLSLTSKTKDK